MARPARPWFRFYVEAVHDRKLRRLKPEYRWLFVACLAAARQSCVPGVLLVGEDDPMDLADLSDFAGMSSKDTAQGIAALVTAGVIEWDVEEDVYSVPNWADRQYESDNVTERTRKHRSKAKERSNDVPENVPDPFEGTPPETETDSDTESSSSPSSVPECVWTDLARKKLAITDGVKHPPRWIATVIENDRATFQERAEWLWNRYEMTPSQLADVLAAGGTSPMLNTLPLRETA